MANQLDLFGEHQTGVSKKACIELFYDKFDLTGRRCRRFLFQGEWYYILVDYALTMGFKDSTEAQRHIDSDQVTTIQELISSTPQICGIAQLRRDTILTTRHGLYDLAYKASKPFRVWVRSLIDDSLGVKPKTVFDGKIAKEQKRLGCDLSTAKERAESKEINREIKSPPFHRAIWEGIYGESFDKLKDEVGPRPLDRSGAEILSLGNLAKYKARLLGNESKLNICKEHARRLTDEFKADFPDGWMVGVGKSVRKGRSVAVVGFVERPAMIISEQENGER